MRPSKIKAVWLLLLFPILLYANALPNAFHYDDLHTITNNAFIQSESLTEAIKKLPTFFTSSEHYSAETHHIGHYRPLLYTTYVLNEAVTGLDPFGFRVINLGLHIACVLSLYFLTWHLLRSRKAAFLSALLLAIHPFFSEGVNYISARSSLLATLFYLLSFLFFIRFRRISNIDITRKSNLKKVVTYFLGFALFGAMALLSKEISLTLPLILLAYDALFIRIKKPNQYFLIALPYLALIPSSFLVFRIINFKNYLTNIYLNTYFIEDYLPSILAQLKGLALVPWLFIMPTNLTIEHNISQPDSIFEPTLIATFTVLSGLLWLTIFLYRNRPKLALLPLWFLITSLPTTFIPLNIPLFEHRGYLPGIALAMGTGYLGSKLLGQGKGIRLGWVIVLVLMLYSAITYQRNTLWQDGVTLWSDAVAKEPDSERAWTNLGLAYQGRKEENIALSSFKRALSINPDAMVALMGMGSIFHLRGDIEAAIEVYQKASSLSPNYYLPYFNMGVAYQQQGKLEKARLSYLQSLKINSHHPQTHLNLGSIHLARREIEPAIRKYQKAIALDPTLSDAHYNLAVAYEASGKTELADQHYKIAERSKRSTKK